MKDKRLVLLLGVIVLLGCAYNESREYEPYYAACIPESFSPKGFHLYCDLELMLSATVQPKACNVLKIMVKVYACHHVLRRSTRLRLPDLCAMKMDTSWFIDAINTAQTIIIGNMSFIHGANMAAMLQKMTV